jgi:hypothetical protein
MRDHAYRRAVRNKWIKRRLFIVKNIWLDAGDWSVIHAKPGKLAKYNFAHGRCNVCQLPRYRDTPRNNHMPS